MNKDQMFELGEMLDQEIRKFLAAELSLLIDNEVIKPEYQGVIVSRIKQLKGE